MPASTLAVLARLGAMFERTASVRDDADLQEVLEDVARAIGEVLGYRAVVINVYRSAFDDMLTAAAVGSDESLHALLGTISPQDTWTPLLADRFRRREGAYFVPDGEFDWDALGVDTYVPDLEPTDDPNAWLPGDALFVPLRDARDQLLGVISVDEPETGMRPSDEELDVLVTISQHAALAMRIGKDIAEDMQHQRMLERVLEVSARLAQARDVDAVLQAVSDGIQDALGFDKVLIGISEQRDRPLVTRASSGWPADAPALDHGASLDALDGPAHRRLRGGRVLPDAGGGRRGPPRHRGLPLPLGAERARPARLVAALADRAARGGRPADRRDLGGRPARPPAAHDRAPAGAAAVREPGGGGDPHGQAGGAPAPRGDARLAHRAVEPARVPGADGARDRAGAPASRCCCATWTT